MNGKNGSSTNNNAMTRHESSSSEPSWTREGEAPINRSIPELEATTSKQSGCITTTAAESRMHSQLEVPLPPLSNRLRRIHFDKSSINWTPQHVLEYFDRVTSQHCLLEELSVHDELLQEQDLSQLQTILLQNHAFVHLKKLNLSNNQLTATAAPALAQILQTTTETLQELNVSHNKLGLSGVTTLVQPILNNTSNLQTLNLGYNGLTRSSAKTLGILLRKNTLSSVEIGGNHLKPQGVKDILTQGLASLNEQNNNKHDNAPSKLQHLDLHATQMGTKGLKAVLELWPRYSQNHHYTVNNNITSLNLASNNLGPQGAKDIAIALTFPNTLTRLDLGKNNIGLAGVTSLAPVLVQSYCLLASLNLEWNQLGDDGLLQLCSALEQNSTCRDLNITGNSIGNLATKRLAETLTINLSLCKLHLDENMIEDEGAMALANALKRKNCYVTTLTYTRNPRISEKGLFYLQHAFAYRASVQDESGWLAQLLQQIQHGEFMMTINWWNNPLQQQQQQQPPNRPLSSTDDDDTTSATGIVTDWEVETLTRCLVQYHPPMLQSLYLTSKYITDVGLGLLFSNYLSTNPPLQRLYLKQVTMGDDSLLKLQTAMQFNGTLRILSITTLCQPLTKRAVQSLAKVLITVPVNRNKGKSYHQTSSIERLNLQGNGLTDDDFNILWRSIQHPNCAVKALNLSHNSLSDESMKFLAEDESNNFAGKSNNALEELYLDHNRITDKGALDLGKAMLANDNKLKVLSIASNELSHKGKLSLQFFAPPRFCC